MAMAKSGQARVLTSKQRDHLFSQIQNHRHPEKNTAIMQISFKLALRVQEIALLQIKEVARLGPERVNAPREFFIHDIMALPAAYTKGSNAVHAAKPNYKRNRVSFSVHDFDRLVLDITRKTLAGMVVEPQDYYPEVKQHKGQSRDLPLVDEALREALSTYLLLRLSKDLEATPSSPLFVSQKGSAYSPNGLQEHMALMLRVWSGIEKASSHSGRRSVLTNIIHTQGKSIKTAQKIGGHKSPSTTIIYGEPPEEEISQALLAIGLPAK
jgi:integrase